MHIERMHCIIEKLTEVAKCELDKGIECVDTKEFGEVIDMIKDLSEAEYYAKISKAMNESEYGEDYDYHGAYDKHERKGYKGQPRDSRGRYMSRKMGYEESPYMHMMDMRDMDYDIGRMYYPEHHMETSRYGKSYDDYMEGRKHYSTSDATQKQERIKMLDEYTKDLTQSINKIMEDVSPEEKSMLRSKLAKLVNAMQ